MDMGNLWADKVQADSLCHVNYYIDPFYMFYIMLCVTHQCKVNTVDKGGCTLYKGWSLTSPPLGSGFVIVSVWGPPEEQMLRRG